jgi:hypothetical protein
MAGQSDLYRTGISITQDFLWDFYQDLLSGLAIAVVIHSVDPSLSSQLIPAHGERESH